MPLCVSSEHPEPVVELAGETHRCAVKKYYARPPYFTLMLAVVLALALAAAGSADVITVSPTYQSTWTAPTTWSSIGIEFLNHEVRGLIEVFDIGSTDALVSPITLGLD